MTKNTKKAKTSAKKVGPKKPAKKTSVKPVASKKSSTDTKKTAMVTAKLAAASAKAAAAKAAAIPSPVTASGLREGDMAPDFTLPDAHGKEHTLSRYRGRKVVLYFYPKDNTPGCTIEACDFRDKNTAINSAGATTFGISPDNGPSHQKFIVKYNLGYTLLCDMEKEVAKKYGVWKEKNNYGQTYWGIERTTIVVDEEGRIQKIYPKVQVQGHVEAVLADLKAAMAKA